MEHGKAKRLGFLTSQQAEVLFFGPLSQVDVRYERMMKRFIPLWELKKYHLQHRAQGGPLKDMALFTRARLSVQPLTPGKSRSAACTSCFPPESVVIVPLLCRGV